MKRIKMHGNNAFRTRGNVGPACGVCFFHGPRCRCKGFKAGRIHHAVRRRECGYRVDARGLL